MASQSERGRAAMSSRITHPHRKKQGTETDEEGRREMETAIMWIHEREGQLQPQLSSPSASVPRALGLSTFVFLTPIYIYAKARDMSSFLDMFNSAVLVDSDG